MVFSFHLPAFIGFLVSLNHSRLTNIHSTTIFSFVSMVRGPHAVSVIHFIFHHPYHLGFATTAPYMGFGGSGGRRFASVNCSNFVRLQFQGDPTLFIYCSYLGRLVQCLVVPSPGATERRCPRRPPSPQRWL